MARGKHIQIIIGVDSRCRIDALNFTGPACQAATAEITAVLGGQVDHQHDKPEVRAAHRCGHQEPEQAR